MLRAAHLIGVQARYLAVPKEVIWSGESEAMARPRSWRRSVSVEESRRRPGPWSGIHLIGAEGGDLVGGQAR